MNIDLNVALSLDSWDESPYQDFPRISILSSDDDDDIVDSPTLGDTRVANREISPSVNSVHDALSPTTNVGVGNIDSNAILIVDLEQKLEAGSAFGSLDQAYLFYCEYGRQKGFSVRRGDQKYVGKTKSTIRWKEFLCHCAGTPNSGANRDEVGKYRKQIKRTQCAAKIRVEPIIPGVWKNTLFKKEHNHPLLSPDQTYLLRSSRILSESRLGVIQSLNSAGIRVNAACGFMEVECGGPHNVGYLRKDVYDKLRRLNKHNRLENADSLGLMDFFNHKTNTEQYFFWKVSRDGDGRLKHFFFRDSRCLSDFQDFGDILSIDTTHKTNKYNLSCAPFVGINHHSTNIMFGVGFLSDETTEAFEWLLAAFLESMNGKHPKVVFSDQCRALMNAIDTTFPNATHRLCQWHVNNNAIKHFGSLNSNDDFKKMWYKCMNWVESEAEFETLWSDMMNTYVPADNTWLPEMYTLRRRWASVFSQKTFTAGMLATSRSEGTHKVLKSMIRSSSSLYEFARAYEKVQSRWREIERAEDATCLWLPGQFVKNNDMLTQAARVYTRAIFKKFEYQCTEAYNYKIDWLHAKDLGSGNIEFKATRKKCPDARARTIIYNQNSNHAHCSCHMWEGHGIFCRHILQLYQVMGVELIPEQFILNRWTKKAKSYASSDQAALLRTHDTEMMRFLDFSNLLMRNEYDMICASKGSAAAQDYLLKRSQESKRGLAVLLGTEGTKGKSDTEVPNEDDKFLDPKVVQDKRFANVRSKEKCAPSGKRGRTSKCPGISTRSRKRSKLGAGSSNHGFDDRLNSSQPLVNEQLRPFGLEPLNFGHKSSTFNATQ